MLGRAPRKFSRPGEFHQMTARLRRRRLKRLGLGLGSLGRARLRSALGLQTGDVPIEPIEIALAPASRHPEFPHAPIAVLHYFSRCVVARPGIAGRFHAKFHALDIFVCQVRFYFVYSHAGGVLVNILLGVHFALNKLLGVSRRTAFDASEKCLNLTAVPSAEPKPTSLHSSRTCDVARC